MSDTPLPRPATAPAAPAFVADLAKLPPAPRLFVNDARLRSLAAREDSVSRQLFELVKHQAEWALTAEPIHFAPRTPQLMAGIREVQERVFALALVHRAGGDARFAEAALRELDSLAARPDWGTGHFLSSSEAVFCFAVGLDWLHDRVSPEQRRFWTSIIVERGLKPSLAVREGTGTWVDADFNWNQVCHACLVAGALAVADQEPELSRRVIERAVRLLPHVGATYAPDGTYPEGPSYWLYGTTYHVLLVELLRHAFGADSGLAAMPGFLESSDFLEQIVGPTGEDFDFSDAHRRQPSEPVLLWFARERGARAIARRELAHLARHHATCHARGGPLVRLPLSRHFALGVLWWEPALPDTPHELPRFWVARGKLHLAVMRSAWRDPRAVYLALKGGSPDGSHAHMDAGSFILEADGVRWALDLGMENYDLMRAARIEIWSYAQDSTRWSTFRVGPEGHNILRFDRERQRTSGRATIRALPAEGGAASPTMRAEVELSSLHAGQVAWARRRGEVHEDRRVVLTDTWCAEARPTTATWQWLTRAHVERTAHGFLLRQDGEQLLLDVSTSAGTATGFEVEDVSEPRGPQDSPNPGLRRIVVSVPTPPASEAWLIAVAKPGACVQAPTR
jgi:hypothetical protein